MNELVVMTIKRDAVKALGTERLFIWGQGSGRAISSSAEAGPGLSVRHAERAQVLL